VVPCVSKNAVGDALHSSARDGSFTAISAATSIGSRGKSLAALSRGTTGSRLPPNGVRGQQPLSPGGIVSADCSLALLVGGRPEALDAALAAIVQAWPHLPESVRSRIVELVDEHQRDAEKRAGQ
jgi:hypothetical protein